MSEEIITYYSLSDDDWGYTSQEIPEGATKKTYNQYIERRDQALADVEAFVLPESS